MKGNNEWFLEHCEEIFALCGICYVVIKAERIIGIFETSPDAYAWVAEHDLSKEATVRYCDGTEKYIYLL